MWGWQPVQWAVRCDRLNKRCWGKCLSLIQTEHERAPAHRISMSHGVIYNISVWHSVILLKLFLPHRGRGKSVWVSVTTISLREDSLTPHGFYKQSLVCTVDHLFDDLIWTIKATSDNWPLHVELQYVAKTDFSILPPLLLSFLWQSKLKGKAWQHVGCLRCTYHTWATRSTCQ